MVFVFYRMEPPICDAHHNLIARSVSGPRERYRSIATPAHSVCRHLAPGPTFDEEKLAALMEKHSIDVSLFGVEDAKTLYELGQELSRGESHLTTTDATDRQTDGCVCWINFHGHLLELLTSVFNLSL